MDHDRGDATHRTWLSFHKGLQRQHGGARPGLPILLDDVDLLEVEARVVIRVEHLLPVGDAVREGGHPETRQRVHVPFPIPA